MNINNLKSIAGLSLSLAKANFKTKNEGSYLGILWYLLNPLAMFLILLLLRGVISNNNIEYYSAYLLIGLIMFNFFRQATASATDSISGNAGLIRSVKIPHEPLVISRIMQSIFSHLFEIIIFAGLLLFLGISLKWILLYPFIFFFMVLFVLGLSFILATIGAYIHDLQNVWSILIHIIFFATPIFYIAQKGTALYLVNSYNPISYFIDIARSIIVYSQLPSIYLMLTALLLSIIFFIAGILIFRRYKDKFPEVA